MRAARPALPEILRRPASGWSSLLVLLSLLVVVGAALADSRDLTMTRGSGGSGLVLLMVTAGLVGFVLARSAIGVLAAHAVGAAVGAVLMLSMAGALAVPDGPSTGHAPLLLLARIDELAPLIERDVRAFLGSAGPAPATMAFLVLGAICWATAQFSTFSVFRHERAGPAIAATGVLLFLDLTLPASEGATERLPVLLVMAAACALAMLLLMQLQVAVQARSWARRRIQDAGEARRVSRRAGTVFVVVTIVAATSLTVVARAPAQDLGEAWAPLGGVGTELGRWLALLAVELPSGADGTAANRLEVADTWRPGTGVAFIAEVDGGLRGNYWWMSAFADFDGRAWTRVDASEELLPAGQAFDIPPDASAAGPFELSTSVTSRLSSPALGTLVAPGEPWSVDRDVRVRSLGDREGLAEVLFSEPVAVDETFVVTSAAHDYRPSGGTLTSGKLRAAGTDYPGWIGRYLRVDAGASGERTRALAERIADVAAEGGRSDPYSMAVLLQDHLRTLGYQTSVEGLCRAGENVPECLLRTEAGFCQHFASTMVIVLRELGIPARFVNGYLPGARGEDGAYIVPRQALHAWVEVYFPTVGWVRFDPTPGGSLSRFQQEPTAFEDGSDVPSPDPGASVEPEASSSAGPSAAPSPSAAPGLAGAGTSGGVGGDPLALAAVFGLAMVVLAAMAGLLLLRLRRLPRTDGALAYSRIVSLAARLGHGPLPSQTELEYAASLGEALPSVRDDLLIVARARVEKRYGHRDVAPRDGTTLRRAYARVRLALVRWRLRGRG